MRSLSCEAAAGAIEVWTDLLRLWEGFRSNGQRRSASGIELVTGAPVGPHAEADRQYHVLVGAVSPVKNCTLTLSTARMPHFSRLQLKKGKPELIIRNNCIPILTLNCHISCSLDCLAPEFELIYARLPTDGMKADLGEPAVVVNRFVIDVVLLRRTKNYNEEKSVALPQNTPWQVMVNRKRQWLEAVESELIAAACHPRRLFQAMDHEELKELSSEGLGPDVLQRPPAHGGSAELNVPQLRVPRVPQDGAKDGAVPRLVTPQLHQNLVPQGRPRIQVGGFEQHHPALPPGVRPRPLG